MRYLLVIHDAPPDFRVGIAVGMLATPQSGIVPGDYARGVLHLIAYEGSDLPAFIDQLSGLLTVAGWDSSGGMAIQPARETA